MVASLLAFAPGTAHADGSPSVTSTISAASPTAGVTYTVDGTGFTAVTNPGDAGVYVGLAPSGGLPDVSSPAGMSAFAGVAYVSPAGMPGGAFEAEVDAPTDKLDTGTSYSLYTWQAHTHSNTSQDTETPVTLPLAQLAAAPVITPTITSQTPADGVSVAVSGEHFVGVTNPGDAGIYVAVAPRGGLPDVSSPDGMSAFAAAAYVPTAAITGGALHTSLTIPTESLDPSQTYSIYTWQAHTHSNTSQDTETALDIDFNKLKLAPVVTMAKTASTYGKAATVTVTVPRATGNVTLSGAGAAQTRALANGKASFTLPAALAAGSHTLTAAYAGDNTYLAGQATAKVSIAKAKATLKTKLVTKAKAKKRGKLRVIVAGVAGAKKPAGKVTLTLTKGKAHKTVKGKKLKNGKIVVKLPKLAKGTWKVKVKYAGNANYKAAKKKVTVKVKK
jgi:hypothetical protein